MAQLRMDPDRGARSRIPRRLKLRITKFGLEGQKVSQLSRQGSPVTKWLEGGRDEGTLHGWSRPNSEL